jgi:uncharacterized repeat protein (TIGR01451 family)
LTLSLGLPLTHQEELSNFLLELYDPASPRYHQYLTTEKFTAQFGPSVEDYQAVVAFARTNGFTITALHPNRMLVSVSAAVADIERTLHVKLNLYRHPTEQRDFYAPDSEPTLDLPVPVLHISGLDNLIIPRPASLKPTPVNNFTNVVPLGGSGPGGLYRGNDFRGAYARSVTLTGTNQMVGLLELDGFYQSDITLYAVNSGIRNVPVQPVLMDGLDGSAGTNNVEVALDIEMAMSMAPGLTQVIVYEGLDTDNIFNRMATDNLAKQLSASWAYPVDATTQQIFRQFAAQGQSFFSASGDDGAYSLSSRRPTDDPYVTIVGGTTLSTTGPGGAWVSETVWNWASVGLGMQASGGGISLTNPIPSWQQGISMSLNKGSTVRRNSPDVSMAGDDVWVTFDNGSNGSFGGTSCSAPLWAGFTALINQQRASLAQPPIGFINPAVYALGKATGYTTNFHDVTVGNNTNNASPTLFYAVTGYDLCTGWGTPIGQNLINSLAPRAAAPVLTNAGTAIVTEGCQPANGTVDPGETVTVNFTLKNIGGIKTTNLVATLQADAGVISPSSPQNYGSLAGGGGAASAATRPFSFTAGGSCGTNLIATLLLSDGSFSLGTSTFNFVLGKLITPFSQNFDGLTAPALPSGWSTSTYSNGTPWVTSTAARDTSPNSAFAAEPANLGFTELVSPSIQITTPFALLSFRNNYNTEVDPIIVDRGYDGGVLEIQVGNNAFTDILAAGGSFAAGGYTRTIDATNDNPFAGRAAWSGNSGGFIPTVVNLPANAAGQTIRLKWRFGTDTGNFEGGLGWYVDSIAITDGAACCNSSADVAVTQISSPSTAVLGVGLNYTINVNNLGPQSAYNVSVSDVLPPNVSFSSAPPGCVYTNGVVVCSPGTLANGSSSSFTISVIPMTADPVTNVVNVVSVTSDPTPTNNSTTLITSVSTNSPPIIGQQPIDALAPVGGNAGFQVTAGGAPPLAYQWFFNNLDLAGATAPSLNLTNVQSQAVGPYFVVVSNPQGSVTSTVAHFALLLPPTISLSSMSAASNLISVSLSSILGATYTLEYKNLLQDSNWTALLPATAGTGGIIFLQDTNAFVMPTRFYRVRAN